jgi:hypothetical protein
MLKRLLVQVADVRRVGDPPPMLDDADPLKLIGAGVIVLVGVALIAWSFRPSRPVRRRAPVLVSRRSPSLSLRSCLGRASSTFAAVPDFAGSVRASPQRLRLAPLPLGVEPSTLGPSGRLCRASSRWGRSEPGPEQLDEAFAGGGAVAVLRSVL